MTEFRQSFSRRMDLPYAAFVLGRCNKCGTKAQKRVEDDHWWHVDDYDHFVVHGIREGCGNPDARFIRVRTNDQPLTPMSEFVFGESP